MLQAEDGIDLRVEELSRKGEGRVLHILKYKILFQNRKEISEIKSYMVEVSVALPPFVERHIPQCAPKIAPCVLMTQATVEHLSGQALEQAYGTTLNRNGDYKQSIRRQVFLHCRDEFPGVFS